MARISLDGLAVGVVFLAGCGGSGSDGPIVGLTTPPSVSIVTPDETATATLIASATSTDQNMVAPGMFAQTSDFETDPVYVDVYDPAMEGLGTINMILCMVGQTAADRMVNAGPYTAQIDEESCQSGAGDSGDEGQSSNAGARELALWTIDSVRETRTSPQTVQVWVPDQNSMDPNTGLIHAEMTLSGSATSDNPFGRFELNFVEAPNGGPFTNPFMFGRLATADAGSTDLGFSFLENRGDVNQVPMVGERFYHEQVNVQMSGDKTTGTARISSQRREDFGSGDTGIIAQEYLVAFNETHFLRQLDANPSVCLSRTSFDSSAWRYNLYYADDTIGGQPGQRVELNSGFGFRTADDYYGWIGYHGLWVPEGATVEDGDTIVRNSYDDSQQDELYTVLRAPGKLIRNTKTELALTDIDDSVRFEWWEGGTRYLVQYSMGSWFRTDEWDDMSGSWTPVMGGPTVIDTMTLGYLGMWSQSLGGSVFYKHAESFVTYYTEEFVTAKDEVFEQALGNSLRLYGYYDALKAAIDQTDADNGDVFLTDAPNLAGAHPYVFDQASLGLFHDPAGDGSVLTAVGLDTGVAPTMGPYTWGMRSGPMLTEAQHNSLNGVDSVWLAEEFYVYETGHNAWNTYTVVVDGFGETAEFDPPLQLPYTHATANDLNDDATYDGQTFLLNYNGPGDVWGIPYEETNGRYYPLLSIASGTLLGVNDEYVIKPVDIEQRLQADPGMCGALDLVTAGAMTLPTTADFVEPDMGARPTVTDPPAVVTGEVVDTTP